MKAFALTAVMLMMAASNLMAEGNPVGKGSRVIGGGFSVRQSTGDLYENRDGEGLTTISLSPSFGYFTETGFMVGAQFHLTSYYQGSSSYKEYGVGPRLAYYFNTNGVSLNARGTIFPYIASYLVIGRLDYNSGPIENVSTLEVGGDLGFLYMLSNSVGLNTKLRYSHHRQSLSNDQATGNALMIALGLSVFLP